MSVLHEFSNENASLLTLLRVKDKSETWSSIANDVFIEGSASRLLALIIDPSVHIEQLDLTDTAPYMQYCLFDDTRHDGATLIRDEYKKALNTVRAWDSEHLNFLSILDKRFPEQLSTIVDAPPLLFAQGQLLAHDRGVSVVGSRHCTPAGAQFARDVTQRLVQRGLTVIAGLAEGIDTVAHMTALSEGGRTVAFIGTGIKRCYPSSNKNLQQEIARQGLVLSQFLPDAPPTRQSFPMRNALMSGYGLASIIVEANEYSGTRSQARQAQHHGRPVILHRSVVENTQWGKSYIGKPAVFVADTVDDVERLLDRIIEIYDFNIDDLIRQMEAQYA